MERFDDGRKGGGDWGIGRVALRGDSARRRPANVLKDGSKVMLTDLTQGVVHECEELEVVNGKVRWLGGECEELTVVREELKINEKQMRKSVENKLRDVLEQ